MKTWSVLGAAALAAAALIVPLAADRTGAVTAATGASKVNAKAADSSFTDSFDGARDADPHYGLNDHLNTRQLGAVRGITFTRVPGLAHAGDSTAEPLRPWHSQVNHSGYPGRLSLHRRTSAVRVDAPVATGSTVSIGATMTPVVGSHTRGEWASLVLGASAASHGYVTDSDSIGLLITAYGKLQLFQYGRLVLSTQLTSVPADGTYHVNWHIVPSSLSITVNGQVVRARISRALAAKVWLFLGRYSDPTEPVTTFDNLSVSRMDPGALAGGPVNTSARLRYFGYFGARIESVPGNHLLDVNGFSRPDWVSISDTAGTQAKELAQCQTNGCILNTRWQFFTDCPGSNCRLRSDARQRWAAFAAAIKPYIRHIGVFDLMDEAYYQGASFHDVDFAAALIKKTFPDKQVMLNFAAPSVSAAAPIPAAVDWVAFDQYCRPMSEVEKTLKTLETATARRPELKLFVYTESARTLCGTTKTDATVAALQWSYYALALRHPRVAGLLPFGLFTSEPTLSPLPLTIDAQQRIAARILH